MMRTPIKPLPGAIERWMRRARWLRAADALTAWLLGWLVLALLADRSTAGATATLALLFTGLAALLPALRRSWRPVSAWVGVSVSRRLRPGDRAWLVLPGEAVRVLVTGRRGLRLVVAVGAGGPTEGIGVRRTRALVVPDDAD